MSRSRKSNRKFKEDITNELRGIADVLHDSISMCEKSITIVISRCYMRF